MCLIQNCFLVIDRVTVCLFELLATLAALLNRISHGQYRGYVEDFLCNWLGCHGASKCFLHTTQCEPFIKMNDKYLAILFTGMLSLFSGDRELQLKRAIIRTDSVLFNCKKCNILALKKNYFSQMVVTHKFWRCF